jgi:hypothetical protein
MKATESFLPAETLMPMLERLSAAMDADDFDGMRRLLCEIVPEYTSAGDLPDWLWMETAQLAS